MRGDWDDLLPKNGATWNKAFEVGRNKELGELVPELVSFFRCVNDRMVDVMDVFKQGMNIHPDFMGSSSIEIALPILVPELSCN